MTRPASIVMSGLADDMRTGFPNGMSRAEVDTLVLGFSILTHRVRDLEQYEAETDRWAAAENLLHLVSAPDDGEPIEGPVEHPEALSDLARIMAAQTRQARAQRGEAV
jgi:hypothetical protein